MQEIRFVVKVFKAKVELQKGKSIKSLRSNKGGKYYYKYDEKGTKS